jgi:hypothetical protein
MKLPEIHRPVIRCEPEEPDMSADTPGPVQALTELFLSGAFPPEFLASVSGHLGSPKRSLTSATTIAMPSPCGSGGSFDNHCDPVNPGDEGGASPVQIQ